MVILGEWVFLMSEVPLHSHSQPLKTDFFPPKAKPLTLAKPTARRVGGARGGNGLDRRAQARRRFRELPLSDFSGQKACQL